ncbi:MAG: MipA/OmpV family protein [Fusobacteriaceae bacterium]
MKRKIYLIGAILTVSTVLMAEGNRIGVGAGVGYSTKMFKLEESKANALPLLDIEYNDIYIKGLTIGYNLHKNDNFTMSLFLDPMSGYAVKGKKMEAGYDKIEDRDTQAMFGAEVEINTGVRDVRTSISFQGGEEGGSGKWSLYRAFKAEKFVIVPSVFVSYFTSDYTDYYFGVSSSEALKNKKINKSYDAEAATSVGVALAGEYNFNEKLSLMMFLGVERFSDEIKNSPIVENDVIFMGGLGAKYYF